MTPKHQPSRSYAQSFRNTLITALGAVAIAGCGPVDETGTSVEEVHRVCATATTVRGIDVSIYQGTIDWAAASRGGVDFAFIRHSHGATTDTNFTRNWNGARAAGILHGAYQYFDPWSDPTRQANAIVDGLRAAGFGPGNLPPVLDVEQPRAAGDPPLPSPSDYATRVRTWVGVIRTRLGVQPIIYTGGYYWDAQLATSEFAALPMWHAQYFNYPDTIYNMNVTPLPNGGCPTSLSDAWPRFTFWQFAGGNGRAPGVSGPVDVDVFNGTIAQLRTLARVPAPDAGTPDSGVRRDAGTPDASIPRDVIARDTAMSTDGDPTDLGVPGDDAAIADDVFADSGVQVADARSDAARGDALRSDATGDTGDATAPPGCACRTPNAPVSSMPRALSLAAIAAIALASRRRSNRARCFI